MPNPETNYVNGTDPTYPVTAAETFEVQLLPNAEVPVEIDLAGPCPRCAHRVTHRHPTFLVKSLGPVDVETAKALYDLARSRGVDLPHAWTFQVDCGCHTTHPNAPKDLPGCGAFWNMTVERQLMEDDRDA